MIIITQMRIRFGLVLAILVMAVGCREKNPTVPPPATESPILSTSTNKLQAEIGRVNDLPREGDPTKRPLMISAAAANRREWTVESLRQGYLDTGRTNAQWDKEVMRAFDLFADYTNGKWEAFSNLTTQVQGIPTECDDPMVVYMRTRYRPYHEEDTYEYFALAYLRAQERLLRSRYHPAYKCMAGIRAVEATRDADSKVMRGVRTFLTCCCLEDLARDSNAPPEVVFDTAGLWLNYSDEQGWYDQVMHDLQPILERNWGQYERWFRLRGWLEIQYAWNARSRDAANKVTAEGWKGFAKHLEEADSFLTKAWQMDSNQAVTAFLMMRVEHGQGKGLERMRTWFQRAMKLEPNYGEAARMMAYYLEPRWYGSEEETLEFARSCVASTNWGGEVPLVLVDAHYSLAGYYGQAKAAEYWERPQVWKDISSAYEKFFQMNTNVDYYHNRYAKDAYLCGHYGEFLKQLKALSNGTTNLAEFGGEAELRKMLAKTSSASKRD